MLSVLLQITGGTDSPIDFILENDIIDSATTWATLFIMGIAAVVAPFFYALSIVNNFLKSMIESSEGGKKKYFEKKEVIRVSVLYGILTIAYFPLFGSITLLCGYVQQIAPYSKTMAVQSAIEKNYEQIGKALHGVKEGVASGNLSGAASSAGTALNETVNTAITPLSSAWYGTQDFIVSGLAGIIGYWVESFALVLTKLCFAFGPLVIAFSILPFNRDKFNKWLQVFLNVLCWPLTCAVLDSIYNGMFGDAIGNFGETDFGAFEILYIASYCLVPWITSWYIGTSDGSRLLSMSLTVMSTAITQLSTAIGGTGNLVRDAGKFAKGMAGNADAK